MNWRELESRGGTVLKTGGRSPWRFESSALRFVGRKYLRHRSLSMAVCLPRKRRQLVGAPGGRSIHFGTVVLGKVDERDMIIRD